jgi:hypothetical protein
MNRAAPQAASLVARALRAEQLLASLASPNALPWDALQLQPLPRRQQPPPPPPSHSSLLSSLAEGGQHAEAGVLLLACHDAGLPRPGSRAVGSLLVSAAQSNGLVLSPGEVAALVGLGRSVLPEATLLRMLQGHCAHGRYSEALALAAELQRAESPQAQHALQLVLEAAAAGRAAAAAEGGAAAALLLPPQQQQQQATGGSLTELMVRSLLDPALPGPEVRVYTSSLAALLRSPSALHEAGLAQSLWGACTALQAAAGRQAPLVPSTRNFLLSAALVNGDVHTLRSVLAHQVAHSSSSSSSSIGSGESLGGSPPSRLLLLRCAHAFEAAGQWQDALDTLELAEGGVGRKLEVGGALPLFSASSAAASSAAASAAESAAMLPPSAVVAPQECPLWRLCFQDAAAAAAAAAAPPLGLDAAVSDAVFPPSNLDGVPEELLLHELAIQALSKLGRHEAALQLWERERVQQRLLEFLEPPPPPAGAAAAPGAVGLGVLEIGDEDFHGFRCGELGELAAELGHAFVFVGVEE